MDIKTLAQQYIREYKSTPEFGNWDTVIEIGKQLADAVLSGAKSEHGLSPREPAKVATSWARVLTKKERALIEEDKFLLAIKEVRQRLCCGLVEAKRVCDGYRSFVEAARAKPAHRPNCGGCLECSPVPWKKP